MILHCTPPYNPHIPNPALGYLKGFLESRGVTTKNVYWNLILSGTISTFQKGLDKYVQSKDLYSILPVLYLCRQLLAKQNTKTPLDLFYTSIYSEKELFDMGCAAKEYIDQVIQDNRGAVHGFTVKSYQWLIARYLIQRLKAIDPDTTIILGGVTSKEQGYAFMRTFPEVDYAIWGEGEYPLLHLVKALKEDTPIIEVPNLIYRGDTLSATTPVHANEPLDSYPFADHTDYIETFKKYMAGKTLSEYVEIFGRYASDQYPVIIPVWGSRSCPWNKCKFCVLNEQYKYRARSPENIVKEIEYQSEKYRVNSFIFVDTELPGNLNRFKTLLTLIMQRSAEKEKRYRFFAEVSPVFINEETAHYMQLASFAEIQIGFEGMTDSLLKKMEKRHRFAHNIQALKLGSQYNLNMRGLNIIRGIPPETKEDIIESCENITFLRFLLSTYTLNPTTLRLDKGSPFYQETAETKRDTWKNNPVWMEVEPLGLIPVSERFNFFGFSNVVQHRLWVDFVNLLKSYTQQNHSYVWMEYENGSLVEEKGLRIYKYVLDRDETDVLLFCDTIKSFKEIKQRFPHVPEEKLYEILKSLKRAGFLYCNKDFSEIISVLTAGNRHILVY
jgi:radical SAM superfamily enzyme YgiQ (UPF0313 family)